MNLTVSKENYLKAIAEAELEGEPVIGASLARWLRISPPAVTAGLHRLKRDRLIQTRKNGEVTLTRAGRAIADQVLRRHHLIERMLTEVFGMEWYKVHDEAERLEHAVSGDFEDRLIAVLGADGTCPHGSLGSADSPSARRERGWLRLSEVSSPAHLQVMSVFERDRALLEFLDRLSIIPGRCMRWAGRNYDETTTLQIEGQPVNLGGSAATRVWVRPARPGPECRCGD